MAVLRHSVTVLAVERALVAELAPLLWDLAESTRAEGTTVVTPDGQPVEDLRLLKGRHLRAGALYEIGRADDGERMAVRIREWRRASAVEVEQRLSAPDLNAKVSLRLTAPDRPRLVEGRGRMWGPDGSGVLRRGSGRARADLAAWWDAAALPPGAPPAAHAPVTVRLKHLLGEARLHLRPRRAEDERWAVEAVARLLELGPDGVREELGRTAED
ncbi:MULTISPECIES: hypothetical protein [unclassified Streptomyces]|uniref:hypothetical protein n=1 Tax=unclassified Streptomyces TaxID=2593676 RepID=UPI000366A45C|nr:MULTISPECIES: hypothetical protein [unclassified Streptomyces]MYQ77960.1 hypothetical protein [Streptomyces sp. SID4923]